jgi:hypothetical protein
MVIRKVVLRALGNKGLEVTVSGERTVNDQLSAKRETGIKEFLPLPIPLRQKFYRFKYFFLTMLGVWRDEWTEFLLDDYSGFTDVADILEDSDIEDEEEKEKYGTKVSKLIMAADNCFSNTSIFGYELNGTEVKIIGEYEQIEGKSFKPPLPFVSEDDDYNFHSEVLELMKEVSTDIMTYIREEKIELGDIKELLLQLNNSDDAKDRIQKQNEDENYLEMVHLLSNQGVFIPAAGSDLEKQLEENTSSSKAKVVSKNTIDDSNFETPENQENGDDPEE